MLQNNAALKNAFYCPEMSDTEFRRLSGFIHAECGIKLPPVKKTMLTLRLVRRLRSLGMTSFSDYYDYVSHRPGRFTELPLMINVVSTNKTEFFRESRHFDFLVEKVLPDLTRSGLNRRRGHLEFLSAGCSSGEEPYTLAMVLDDFFRNVPEKDFSILATDISTDVLQKAVRGIYPDCNGEQIPLKFRKQYLMRGKGSQSGYCRVVPELRSRIRFQRLNLKAEKFHIGMMDVIFCRNVIIYFDRETQKALFNNFYDHLNPGGYLFIGHSESLHGINDRFRLVVPTVYRKPI